MGILSRVKGRLKDEIKKRVESEAPASMEEEAHPDIQPAGPAVLPDPDVRPNERDAAPWFVDEDLDGWDDTNPDD